MHALIRRVWVPNSVLTSPAPAYHTCPGRWPRRWLRGCVPSILGALLVAIVFSTAARADDFRSGEPILATTYFYWYDTDTKEHIVNADGTDALTHHPPTLKGFSYKNVSWHEQQLADMIAAGIDVVLPVYFGSPAPIPITRFSDEGLPTLVAARDKLLRQGKRPPAIGMFYDTSSLCEVNGLKRHVDLRTEAGKDWFYETIRRFFARIPPAHRARIDGKPLVFIYTLTKAKGLDRELFPYVRARFQKDFGSDLFLVNQDAECRHTLAATPEVQQFVRQVRAGSAPAALQRHIRETIASIASDTFYRSHGGQDEPFVEALYQQVFLRAPDPDGQAKWVRRLKKVPRVQIVTEFFADEDVLGMQIASWLQTTRGVGTPGKSDADFAWVGFGRPEYHTVSAIGPGYDDHAVLNRKHHVVSREDGKYYQRAWERFFAPSPRSWLIHLETWNEFHEGSDIAESREFGRKYIELTRRFADRFHRLSRPKETKD